METQLLPKMMKDIRFLLFSGSLLQRLPIVKLVFATIITLLTLVSPIAYADISTVVAVPASVGVPIQGTATIKIKWQVLHNHPMGFPANLPITSTAAQLQLNGTTIASIGGMLSKISPLTTFGDSTVITFNETLIINAALARRIAESAPGSISIRREFTDPDKGGAGFVQLSPGNGNSGQLSIRRIDLSFENKARTDVVYKNESIRAYVDISFRSSGILRGEWRLVDPTASLGASGGRVLQVVQKNLVSSGNGRTRIVSPPLPTNVNGLYLLAFSVQQSDASLETPVLRYFVLDKNGIPPVAHIGEIAVVSPGDNAPLTEDTVFSWQTFEGAQAYQVEIFNRDDNIAISGKLIPASIAKLSLSSFSLEALLAGYEYDWKVRAFNNQGKVIGESEPQLLYMPK